LALGWNAIKRIASRS